MAINKLTATLQSNKPEQAVDHVVIEDDGVKYILTAKVVNQTVFLKPKDWSRFGDEYSLACSRMDLPKGVTTQITFSEKELSSPSGQNNLLDAPFASRVRTDLFASSGISDPLTPKIIPIVQKQLLTSPAPTPAKPKSSPQTQSPHFLPLPPLPPSSSQPAVDPIKIQKERIKERECEDEIDTYLVGERQRNPDLNFKDLKDLFRDDKKKRFGPLSPKLETFLKTKSSTWSETLTFPLSQEIKGHLSNVYFNAEKVKNFSEEERKQIASWSQQFTEDATAAEIIKKDHQAYEAFTSELNPHYTLPSKPLGLLNLLRQNNCWLNSILQFSLTLPGFYESFQSNRTVAPNRQALFDAMREFTSNLSTKIGPLETQPIRAALSSCSQGLILHAMRQEDAHEGLLQLLSDSPLWDEVLITEEKEAKPIYYWTDGDGNEREIQDGSVTLKPPKVHKLPFDKILSLNIEYKTLQQIVTRFFEEKARGDEETFYRETDRGKEQLCRLVRVKRSFSSKPPSSLPLQIKRFYDDGSKNKTPLFVPLTLDIPYENQSLTYELKAFVSHSGNSMNDGHYVSYVKRGGQWYFCNDTLLQPVDEDQILKEAKGAYLLNYTKIDPS